MAEVPININGVIVDYYGRTIMGPVKIVGSMSRTDVGIGGGPIYPPGGGEKPPGGGDRPGIWPGPGDPDYPAGSPHPEHPIVLPKPPIDPPPVDPPTQPADPQWQWVYSARYGWHPAFVPGPGDAQPH